MTIALDLASRGCSNPVDTRFSGPRNPREKKEKTREEEVTPASRFFCL